MMFSKTLAVSRVVLLLAAASAPAAHASYENFGGGAGSTTSSDFSLLGTAWTLNGGVRALPGPAQAGSANWSIMTSGLSDVSGFDAHGGNVSSVLASLYAGGVDELTSINLALNAWAAVSGFSNLGQVADGGGGFGAAGAAGAAGHIRVGAVFIDGAAGSNVLAHAFNPCNATSCGAGGGIGGDLHFDNANAWSDCVTFACSSGTIDFYTVALHELGHALGLDHSTVVGSVMEATYAGVRRNLSADDILGIQALYGVNPVPEPSTYLMLMAGMLGVLGYSRKRLADTGN